MKKDFESRWFLTARVLCLSTAAVSRDGAQQWRGAWGWDSEVVGTCAWLL